MITCPDCGGPMVSRMNTKTNQRFWGCKRYPECRGTRDTDGRSKQERDLERATPDTYKRRWDRG